MLSWLRPSTWALVAFVFALSLYANSSRWIEDPSTLAWLPPFKEGVNLNRNTHLGAEYFEIARALVEGRGFSDPFGRETGPTAWMPPAYPVLLAALLWLFGPQGILIAVLVLKNCALVWTGSVVYDLAGRTGVRLAPRWALVAYGVWLVAHFGRFFQTTHDTWLLLALLTANFYLVARLLLGEPVRLPVDWRWAWGLLGGLNFLTSPIAGVAWTVASGFVAWRRREFTKPVAAAVLVALLCTSGWVVRNFVVFDRLILMKSNFYFDAHFANFVNPTGVYDSNFFIAHHPMWVAKRDPDFLYGRLGEVAFMDLHKEKFFENLRAAPHLFARRVGARLKAATLVYHPRRAHIVGKHPLLPTVVHLLPLLGFVALIAVRRRRLSEAAVLAGFLYASYLAPYVLFAFYNRYLLPLSAILVLAIYWGADALASRGSDPEAQTSSAG